jgi:hypothetical protein
MKANSRPVNPEQLGIIGRDHLAAHLLSDGGDPANFRYKRVTGEREGIDAPIPAARKRSRDRLSWVDCGPSRSVWLSRPLRRFRRSHLTTRP